MCHIMTRMESVLGEILDELRAGKTLTDTEIAQILARWNRQAAAPVRKYAKKHLVPYYLDVKSNDPSTWKGWNVDADLEARLLATLRMKPRRTSSGVATITVITKPWPCANNCLYCPNDVRMPKSYLHDEPACQRAERNCFDPYMQVASRLRALKDMGHITDKIELIVLGGTWSDYPRAYQIWFVRQLFDALNDDDDTRLANAVARRHSYEQAGMKIGNEAFGITGNPDELQRRCSHWQNEIEHHRATYNEAVCDLYGNNPAWIEVSSWQTAHMEDLELAHRKNETAAHRVVGLVVETRPDAINAGNLRLIRELGATKVQMGIQSLDSRILALNNRQTGEQTVQHAMDLARLFGFKVHTHFMVNLLGASPSSDKADYARFATDIAYQPDEVKLYPCALVAGTGLQKHYEDGTWKPYTEDELLDVLVADTLTTCEFTRVSRMIRDISAGDIVAGNKKANLRQLVESAAEKSGRPIREMRHRELNASEADLDELELRETHYDTLSTHEVFLQWTTPQDRIVGFLRLSLPDPQIVAGNPELPLGAHQAMIREVHVYGRVASIGNSGSLIRHKPQSSHNGVDETRNPYKRLQMSSSDDAQPNAQHAGLGKGLVQRACEIAETSGYHTINVISAIGTRNYYRNLGFHDAGLYLAKELHPSGPSIA